MLNAILRKVWIKMLLSDYFYLIYLFVMSQFPGNCQSCLDTFVLLLWSNAWENVPRKRKPWHQIPSLNMTRYMALLFIYCICLWIIDQSIIQYFFKFLEWEELCLRYVSYVSWLYFQDPKENTAGFIPAFLPQLLCFVLDCHLCAVDCLDIFLIFSHYFDSFS